MPETASKDTPAGPSGERSYRISELAEVTGVPRETIKYYFREGLLPRVRTGRREWTLYSGKYVELIRLIHQYQNQTRLTLPQIAKVYRKARFDPKELEIELLTGRHNQPADADVVVGIESRSGRDGAPPRGTSGTPDAIELPEAFVAELRAAGLAPRRRDLGAAEKRTAALVLAGVRGGIPLPFYREMQELLARIADAELKAILSLDLTGPDRREDRNRQIVETNRIINRWLTREKDRLIQKQLARTYETSRRNIEQLRSWIYLPSDAFIRKHGADRQMAGLEREARSPRHRIRLLPGIAEAALALGRIEDAGKAAKELLDAGAPTPGAYIAAIRAAELRANARQSADLAARAVAEFPGHPAVYQAAAADCLYQASLLFTSGKSIDWLTKAGELFAKAMSLRVTEPRLRFDQRFLLGQAHSVLPGALGSSADALAALDAALVQLKSPATLGFAIPAEAEIFRISIWYYLGQIRRQTGDQKGADEAFRQVVQMDPGSNFGQTAFELTGKDRTE